MKRKKSSIENVTEEVALRSEERRMPECFDPCKAHDKELNDHYSILTWNHLYHAVKRFRTHPIFQVFYEKHMLTAKDDPYFIDELFELAMELDRSEYNGLLITCESRGK